MTAPNVQVAVKPKEFKSYKAFTILTKDFGDSLVQVDIPQLFKFAGGSCRTYNVSRLKQPLNAP